MYVEHYMTKDVITVSEDTRVLDALDIMEGNNFHRLPIVRDGKLIGLISEGIVLENSPARANKMSIHEINYLLTKTTVSQIMTKDVKTVSKDTLIEEAATIMSDNNIGVLPVVDEENHVIGIITDKDVFKAFIDLTGYNERGSRLILDIPEDHPGILEDITNILAESNTSITHIYVHRIAKDFSEVTIQLDTEDASEIEELLRYEGYSVKNSIATTPVDKE
ncbi:CBS and ACT domain-containing protein [Lacticigenium naphthae]|uniref:CBS and ACT domain-containing protein n=1 Tax=Lacticigenium naphthae TaxID=515351 RepID=UPI000421CE5C|nr:CBS and ACT domain-containing protein [Lacticigenium naphthae]